MTENKNIIIATIKSWNIEKAKKLISDSAQLKTQLVTNKDELTFENISKINPKYIFFPHWSWIIPKKIYDNFECVVFHMTDLPFGRGGSPLQNLIERGIYKTKISAIRVVGEVDAGPIYLKRDLDLQGSASEIFKRACKIVFNDMIPYIIEKNPTAVPQSGQIVKFNRRTPEQSNIASANSLTKIYDYIRMLDAEGYPPAFVETAKLMIEFSDVKLEDGYVLSQAKIRIKDG
ncbi:MAG: hypothetical protein KAV87_23555 [Desulfobacteraceae bacterium]|nr:hypothetical protein [Desulfobacteraceae bacterium]